MEVLGGRGLLRATHVKMTDTNNNREEVQHFHCWLNLQLFVPLPKHGTGCKQLGNQPSFFSALMYLHRNYSSNFTCILRIWLPLLTKSQTLNWRSSGHAQLYTVIYIKWPLSKHLWLSDYSWKSTSRNICLPSNWDTTCIFRNTITHVVLLHTCYFFPLNKLAILQAESRQKILSIKG